MYRWHKERARSERALQRKILFHDVDEEWIEQWPQILQLGRYRKSSGLGCSDGHCPLCHSPREKDRQERRSDIDFAEQKKEV